MQPHPATQWTHDPMITPSIPFLCIRFINCDSSKFSSIRVISQYLELELTSTNSWIDHSHAVWCCFLRSLVKLMPITTYMANVDSTLRISWFLPTLFSSTLPGQVVFCSTTKPRNLRGLLLQIQTVLSRDPRWPGYLCNQKPIYRADSRFAPSQWERALLCNDVSHWLGASLESALIYGTPVWRMRDRYTGKNHIRRSCVVIIIDRHGAIKE